MDGAPPCGSPPPSPPSPPSPPTSPPRYKAKDLPSFSDEYDGDYGLYIDDEGTLAAPHIPDATSTGTVVAISFIIVLYAISTLVFGFSPLRLLPRLQVIGAAAWLFRIYRRTGRRRPILYDGAMNFYDAMSILNGASPSSTTFYEDAGVLLERVLVMAVVAVGAALVVRGLLKIATLPEPGANEAGRKIGMRMQRLLTVPRLELSAVTLAALPCAVAVAHYLADVSCCASELKYKRHHANANGLVEAVIALIVPCIVLTWCVHVIVYSRVYATYDIVKKRWDTLRKDATAEKFVFMEEGEDSTSKEVKDTKAGFVEQFGVCLEPYRGPQIKAQFLSPLDRAVTLCMVRERRSMTETWPLGIHMLWLGYLLQIGAGVSCAIAGTAKPGDSRLAGVGAIVSGIFVGTEALAVASTLPYHAMTDNVCGCLSAALSAAGFFVLSAVFYDDKSQAGGMNGAIKISVALHAFSVCVEAIAILALMAKDAQARLSCLRPQIKSTKEKIAMSPTPLMTAIGYDKSIKEFDDDKVTKLGIEPLTPLPFGGWGYPVIREANKQNRLVEEEDVAVNIMPYEKPEMDAVYFKENGLLLPEKELMYRERVEEPEEVGKSEGTSPSDGPADKLYEPSWLRANDNDMKDRAQSASGSNSDKRKEKLKSLFRKLDFLNVDEDLASQPAGVVEPEVPPSKRSPTKLHSPSNPINSPSRFGEFGVKSEEEALSATPSQTKSPKSFQPLLSPSPKSFQPLLSPPPPTSPMLPPTMDARRIGMQIASSPSLKATAKQQGQTSVASQSTSTKEKQEEEGKPPSETAGASQPTSTKEKQEEKVKPSSLSSFRIKFDPNDE